MRRGAVATVSLDGKRIGDAASTLARVGASPGYWPGAPDLAVEVVSPNDTYTEVHEKALVWLAAGCRVVLVVDPVACDVTRYRSREEIVSFTGEQPVDGTPAMPGFGPAASALLGARG